MRGLSAVDRARHQLLAGAALALDEHRGIAARHPLHVLQDTAQRLVLADDVRDAAPERQFFAQQEVLGQHAPLLDGAPRQQQQVLGIDRLGDEIERTLAHGAHRVLDSSIRGHHDDGQVGIGVLGQAQHAEAVTVAEAQVREHQRRPMLIQRCPRVVKAGRFDHR